MLPIIDTLFPLGNFFVVKAEHVGVGGVSLEAVLHASELELAKKVNKEYVDEQIASIPRPDVTKLYVDSNFAKKTDIPAVPTKTSQLQNDSGFLTQHQDLSAYAKKAEIPTVPTKTSQLQNDSGFLTQHQSLDGYATQKSLENTNANVSALSEKVTQNATKAEDLQAQIDNLVIESGGDGNAEVVQARTDSFGVEHTTLKSRIDSDVNILKDDQSADFQYNRTGVNSEALIWSQGGLSGGDGKETVNAKRIRTQFIKALYKQINLDIPEGYSAMLVEYNSERKFTNVQTGIEGNVKFLRQNGSTVYFRLQLKKNDDSEIIPSAGSSVVVEAITNESVEASNINPVVKNTDMVLGQSWNFANSVSNNDARARTSTIITLHRGDIVKAKSGFEFSFVAYENNANISSLPISQSMGFYSNTFVWFTEYECKATLIRVAINVKRTDSKIMREKNVITINHKLNSENLVFTDFNNLDSFNFENASAIANTSCYGYKDSNNASSLIACYLQIGSKISAKAGYKFFYTSIDKSGKIVESTNEFITSVTLRHNGYVLICIKADNSSKIDVTNVYKCISIIPISESNECSRLYTTAEFREAIKKVCAINGVPYIGLSDECGFGLERIKSTEIYNVDSIHHTELGGYYLASAIWRKIKEIPPFYTSIPAELYTENPWNGKTWYAYGTSLTAPVSGKYPAYVAQMSGMTLVNKGHGGQGITNGIGGYIENVGQNKTSVMNITDGKLNADLITLEVGANDGGALLGSVYDTGDNTFCGCLNQCIQYLQKNTTAQIVIISSSTSRSSGDVPLTIDRKNGRNSYVNLNVVNAVWEQGSIYYADGTEATSTKSIRTEYIELEKGNYSIRADYGYHATAYFYDSQKTYLGAVTELTLSRKINIPYKDAKYLRITFRKSDDSTGDMTLKSHIDVYFND